ncbi:MAG: RDD family protein [Tepidisphaeraceae bacterium]
MPGNEWYYAQDNRQFGPVTIEVLIDMLRQGHVRPTDLVWTENMPDWRPASGVAALMAAMQATAAGTASVTGAAAVANLAGANASLNYFSPSGPIGYIVYAGFWMRFAAAIIDYIILAVVERILQFVVGMGMFAPGPRAFSPVIFFPMMGLFSGGFVLRWLYFALMESSQYQATVGKLALGIIVTNMQGQRVGFGQATGRYFGKFISYMTLMIGFMMAGWTQQKQALHDMLAGCLVIRKQ